MKKRILIALALVLVLACTFVACDSTPQGGTLQLKDISVRISGEKVTLQKADATEAALRAQLTVVGIKDDDSQVIISDYTLEGFNPSVVNQDQTVTVKYGSFTKTVTVYVADGDAQNAPIDLKTVFAYYEDDWSWNFRLQYEYESTEYYWFQTLQFCDGNVQIVYEEDGEKYTEYLVYSEADDAFYYYVDNGDGTYEILDEDDEYFLWYAYYAMCVDLTDLASFTFTQSDGYYVADNPAEAGNAIFGEEEDCEWTSLQMYVSGGKISKIVAVQDDSYYGDEFVYTLQFDKYEQVSFKIPTVGTPSGPNPENPKELADIFAYYEDDWSWNFRAQYEYKSESSRFFLETYYYNGNIKILLEDPDNGEHYTDYFVYSADDDAFYYYCDNGDGTYDVYDEDNDEFIEFYDYIWNFDLTDIASLKFEKTADCYVAADAQAAGDEIFFAWQNCQWKSLSLYVSDGKISKIVAEQYDSSYKEDFVYTLILDNYGKASFTVPTVSGGGNNPSGDYAVLTLDSLSKLTTGTPIYAGGVNGYDTVTWQENGITLFNDMHTSKNPCVDYINPARFYGDSIIEISYIAPIQSIVLTVPASNSTGLNGVTVAGAKITRSGSGNDTKITITFNSPTEKFVATLTAQLRIFSVEVNGDGSGAGTSGGVMPEQSYNEATFDYDNLQDKMSEKYYIGLPSTGTYTALVVPIRFRDTTITSADLQKLNKAFNGTSADTGWQSVAGYYALSSFGALNLSFDIWGVNIGTLNTPFDTANSYSYYETYKKGGVYCGEEALLLEVLQYLENQGVDLSKYDTNGDGAIDAVYLIYSADVDYDDAEFWWAYVTWYDGEETFGKKDVVTPYYYLFAGFDFMEEDTSTTVGLSINASTYIHETGHLLGLDDYYDYDTSKGANKGLGGADMMDYTVGDHNVYSKIMLGWLTPTVITSTQTFTIDLADSDHTNDCVMLLLNSNNSYFCEYLLVDLYSATGLNEMHAKQYNSYLYGGASFGARIYHVTSWCDKPYSDDYKSFTNCNNTYSKYALIKLVEADGGNSTTKTKQGLWASANDLWQTGGVLSNKFARYTRNDGKVINFDISFDFVTATSATITVTFASAN